MNALIVESHNRTIQGILNVWRHKWIPDDTEIYTEDKVGFTDDQTE